jgi:hypothetical protein
VYSAESAKLPCGVRGLSVRSSLTGNTVRHIIGLTLCAKGNLIAHPPYIRYSCAHKVFAYSLTLFWALGSFLTGSLCAL